jgi:predicted ABC-type transport system involved in lysophospholipase L1 biosynthesis ATPase subunit
MDLLCGLNRERQQTFVLVTHDPGIAQRTERIVRMSDGQVVSDEPVANSGSDVAANAAGS